MSRSCRALAALLFVAAPLNAQIARVAAPVELPAAVVAPLGVSAAAASPLFAAPALTAAPPFAAPSLLAAPAAALLPAAAPSFAPSAAALPSAAPTASLPVAPSLTAPAPAAAAPLAAVDGFAPKRPQGDAGPAASPDSDAGRRIFDGSGDFTTRSGSVFAVSAKSHPAVRGPALVRVQASPAAPVKAVPDTQGLRGAALLDRIGSVAAKNQRVNGYHEASHYLFATADNHTLNGLPGVADAYSGVFIPGTSPNGQDYSETGDPTHDGWSRPQGMNVEHVFPQSLFQQHVPMRSDLHHLMATFEHPNGMRGNLPFGVVKGPVEYRNDAGAKRGGGVFEPPDFTKGRVARAMLYFYSRYKNEAFFDQHAAAFWNSQVETLLDWNRRFPPTVEERKRNDQVEAFQGNRNPYVDDPTLAERVGLDAFLSPLARPAAAVRSVVQEPAPARRSDKPRKGKKRSAYNRRNSSRNGRR